MAGKKQLSSSDVRRDHLLALTGSEELVTITIDSGARDFGNSPNTDLREGLLLVKNTATGKYTHFDKDGLNGTDDPSTALVLMYPVKDVTDRDAPAAAYTKGTFNAARLIVNDEADFDWKLVEQRLVRL
jgi:hypothetical protein